MEWGIEFTPLSCITRTDSSARAPFGLLIPNFIVHYKGCTHIQRRKGHLIDISASSVSSNHSAEIFVIYRKMPLDDASYDIRAAFSETRISQ